MLNRAYETFSWGLLGLYCSCTCIPLGHRLIAQHTTEIYIKAAADREVQGRVTFQMRKTKKNEKKWKKKVTDSSFVVSRCPL